MHQVNHSRADSNNLQVNIKNPNTNSFAEFST